MVGIGVASSQFNEINGLKGSHDADEGSFFDQHSHARVPGDVPDLLPSASAIYAKKVGRLTEALNQPQERAEAAEALRGLIDRIVPGPNKGEIDAMLYGDLGTILNWVDRQPLGRTAKTNTPGAGLTGVSVSVVAGARNHRYRHSLMVAI